MASKGAIDVYINALPDTVRYPLRQMLYYLMDNWRLGNSARAENAQWYAVSGTTHGTAGTEFTIRHGLGASPARFIPVLDLSAVNAAIVPLQVTRAADATFVYLKSSSTNVAFTGYVE